MSYTSTFFFILFSFLSALAQSKLGMCYVDKIRIREAINISSKFGDKIWKGIRDVPFAVILVTESVEFIIKPMEFIFS
jgi:hypothetical protein